MEEPVVDGALDKQEDEQERHGQPEEPIVKKSSEKNVFPAAEDDEKIESRSQNRDD